MVKPWTYLTKYLCLFNFVSFYCWLTTIKVVNIGLNLRNNFHVLTYLQAEIWNWYARSIILGDVLFISKNVSDILFFNGKWIQLLGHSFYCLIYFILIILLFLIALWFKWIVFRELQMRLNFSTCLNTKRYQNIILFKLALCNIGL